MSFFISVIIFVSINILFTKVKSTYLNIQNIKENNVNMETENVINNIENGENKKSKVKPKEYKETDDKSNNSKKNAKENLWQIEIPKIDLIAPIAEGTTQEVMDKYVGHFESTEKWSGNIGLAAHNRRISS